jgi:hypothetical protein
MKAMRVRRASVAELVVWGTEEMKQKPWLRWGGLVGWDWWDWWEEGKEWGGKGEEERAGLRFLRGESRDRLSGLA